MGLALGAGVRYGRSVRSRPNRNRLSPEFFATAVELRFIARLLFALFYGAHHDHAPAVPRVGAYLALRPLTRTVYCCSLFVIVVPF